MNKEALKVLYKNSKKEGYTGSFEEFITLMKSNSDAVEVMYDNAKNEGYTDDIETFNKLVGYETESTGSIDTEIKEEEEVIDTPIKEEVEVDEKEEIIEPQHLSDRVIEDKDKHVALFKQQVKEITSDTTISIDDRKEKVKKLKEEFIETGKKDIVSKTYIDLLMKKNTEKIPEEKIKEWENEAATTTRRTRGTGEYVYNPKLDNVVEEVEYYEHKPYEDFREEAETILQKEIDDTPDLVAYAPLTEENIIKKSKELYIRDKEQKYRRDNRIQLLEEFEDFHGGGFLDVDNIFKVIKVASLGPLAAPAIATGVVDLSTSSTYKKSRTSLTDQAIKDFESLQPDIKAETANIGILNIEAESVMAEIRALKQKDKASNKDVARFEELRDMLPDLERDLTDSYKQLGKLEVKSNQLKEIAGETTRTYNALEIASNNIAATSLRLIAGLGSAISELSVASAVERVYDIDLSNDSDLEVLPEWMRPIAKIHGSSKDLLDKGINEIYKNAQEITDETAEPISLEDIDSLSDFGQFMLELGSNQVINTAVTASTGGIGLGLVSVGAMGNKFHEMDEEMSQGVYNATESIKQGEAVYDKMNISPWKFYATGLLYGGAEFLTEKVALSQLKFGAKNFKKAFNINAKKTGQYSLESDSFLDFGKKYMKGVGDESAAEGLAQLGQNWVDINLLEKDISYLQGVTEASISGGLMSGGMFQAPALVGNIVKGFQTNKEYQIINKNSARLLELHRQVDALLLDNQKDLSVKEALKAVRAEQESLVKENIEAKKVSDQRIDDLVNTGKIQKLIDIEVKNHEAKRKIDEVNVNPKLDEKTKKSIIETQMDLININEAHKNRIISHAGYIGEQTRVNRAAQVLYSELGLTDEIKIVSAKNAKDAEAQAYQEIENHFQEQMAQQEISEPTPEILEQKKLAIDLITETFTDIKDKSNEIAHGFTMPILKTKDGKEFTVPMTVQMQNNALHSKGGNYTVHSHELGHASLFNKFVQNNPNALALINDLSSWASKKYKPVKEILQKVETDYAGESPIRVAEEKLAALNDYIRKRDIKSDMTLRGKLSERMSKLTKGDKNNLNNEIKSGKDVFDMLLSFSDFLNTGELKGLAAHVLKSEVKITEKEKAKVKKRPRISPFKDLTSEQKDKKIIESLQEDLERKVISSKFVQGETTGERVKRQDKRNVDVTDIYKADAAGKNNEQWRDFLDSPKGSRVLGDMINMYYPDMIASAINKKATDPMEVASEAIEPLMKHIQAFNPEQNTDLAGYVGGYLGLKVGTGAKKVAKKTPTISMEKEGVREVAEKQAVEETTTKETKPVRKGIKLAERLGDDAKKISEKVKKMKPVLEGKTYKTLKDLAPDDTQRMFGITPKPGNLSKGDVKNAQAFIRKNADILLAMLPEGTTVGGKATGVQKVLLDAFYNKGRRVKAAKTGSTQGLATQNKKPNIKASEFLEVFGITPAGQPNVSDRNTSSRIKALVDQTGKLLTNQAVREKAIEEGKPVEALSTITEGKSTVMFSKTLKDISNLETQEEIADVITSEKYQKEAEEYRKQGEPNWFYRALRDNVDLSTLFPESFKNSKRVIILKNIGQEFQMEFDPKKSWQDYVKKATKIQLEEARIGVRTSLESIADGLGINIETGKKSLDSLDKLNNAREEIITFLKSKGYTQDQITKYISPALAGPAGLAVFELSDTYNKSKGSNLKLNKTDIKKRSGGFRLGLLGNVKEVADLFNIKGKKATLPSKISAHSNWYTNFSRADQKKYGVKSFDQLSESKKNDYIKNELQPEGLEAKELLSKITKDLREAYFNGEISAQSVATFVETQFAAMKGLGKVASDIRFIPTMSRADIINTFNLDPKDPFVLEHTLPANRIKGLMFNAILNPSSKALKIFEKDLAEYHSAIIPEAFDKKVNYKDGKESFLKVAPAIREAGDFTLSETGRYSDKKIFPMTLRDVNTKETFGPVTEAEAKALLPVKLEQAKSATPANEAMINSTGVMKSKNLNNEETIRQAEILDQALNIARDPNAPVKKIRVFDFDDTLARTNSNVLYTMPGESIVYNASPKSFDQLGKRTGLTFLATDIKEAQAYAENNRGKVREITVDDNALATEKHALNKLKELDVDVTEGLLYEMIDSRFDDYYIGKEKVEQLKKELTKDGFKGFRYEDGSQISNKGTESIAVFDKSSIKPTGKLTAEEFAKKGDKMLAEGAVWDFSEFNKVVDGKKGPLFRVAQKIAEARGTDDVFVLTARSSEAAPAIKEFLDSIGLEIPINNITGLGDSSPLAKSGWMVGKAAEGYNDFYFADDHLGNVKAVEKVMDLVDVKSKVQQAKIKFSKNASKVFNDIIEHKSGIDSFKEYSAAKAKTVGAKKGRWKFWIAPSAEDFVGLLYPLLGKGKVGDLQMAWFKENLLDPYGRAMENLSRKQNRLSNDFKALKKALVKGGSIPKNLNKKAFDKWTYQDLARVATWHMQGFDIPGLSKADLNEMLDFITKNPGIKTFADQLIAINKGDGYAKPGKDWLAGTISTDLLDGLRTEGRGEYLQQWKANKDLIFSEKNLNKLEAAYGPKYREALEDMLRRMETGKNRTSTGNRLENQLLDYINNSVGTVMFLNMRSGILQTLSAVNFLNWSDNNPLKAGVAFANQPRYWKDFMRLMNSDFLIDRRNGLKINVSESEIADAARTSKNKGKAVISYLLQKGFTVTQIMDSFAIASGGATFYRNRIQKYVKQGMTQADAEAKAYLDFREVAEESQQSARPDRISQQQASALGRVILAFANTPMQYNRIMKKAFLDLKNGRGDAKTHISKMIYYGAIQNMMFVALQQAMFAMAFDDEEEPDEVKRKKYMKMGNSMMDNILRGLGIWGTAASTLIAITKKAIEESQKEGYPGADYDAAAMELLNFSPPIDIKVSKLRQAGSNWKYEGWKHDEAAWSMKDPAYKSAAYIISSLTNIPVDRFYKKMDNIQSALDSNNEAWKRVANILGWANWELDSTEERKERRAKDKKRKKEIKQEKILKEEEKKIATMSEAEKKKVAREKEHKKYKDLNKAEQVHKLDSLGLSKSEIRDLKYEKDRVNKLLELMKDENK